MELLAVIIIIGVLAAIALPNFGKAAERARCRSAEAVLRSLYHAERTFHLDNGTYATLAALVGANYTTDPDAGDTDENWNYAATTGGGGQTFTATATRTGGGYDGDTITVDENFGATNTFGGNHPLRTQ